MCCRIEGVDGKRNRFVVENVRWVDLFWLFVFRVRCVKSSVRIPTFVLTFHFFPIPILISPFDFELKWTKKQIFYFGCWLRNSFLFTCRLFDVNSFNFSHWISEFSTNIFGCRFISIEIFFFYRHFREKWIRFELRKSYFLIRDELKEEKLRRRLVVTSPFCLCCRSMGLKVVSRPWSWRRAELLSADIWPSNVFPFSHSISRWKFFFACQRSMSNSDTQICLLIVRCNFQAMRLESMKYLCPSISHCVRPIGEQVKRIKLKFTSFHLNGAVEHGVTLLLQHEFYVDCSNTTLSSPRCSYTKHGKISVSNHSRIVSSLRWEEEREFH